MTIQPLEERLAERAEDYQRYVASEWRSEAICTHLAPLKEFLSSLSVYFETTHLNFSAGDAETAELEIIPFLSKTFAVRWKKEVSEVGVTYQTSCTINSCWLHFMVSFTFDKSCEIKKILTGRYHEKWEQVTRPEYEYAVICSE